ncbi:MAG: glycosyltransferase family 2 protein [Lachnospiraceae bacterium]|nr:glycosyltransferase family 2 protein [Lachnospiraceae bacterium]
MEKVLTFSVAAYNVEKYLEKLLDSIIVAGMNEDIEVLVVNDGSTDRTSEIALQYEARFPEMIKHVGKENGGHGSTINKGIELATGKFFRALDGDDWVDSESLKKVLAELKKTDADLVVVDYIDAYEDGTRELNTMKNLKSGQTYPFDDIVDLIDWCTYHYTIYKTSILKEHHIRLTEHCFYVDSEFCLYPIPYVKDMLYLDHPLYCYRLGYDEQSVSAIGRKKHIEDSDKVSRNMLTFMHEMEPKVSPKRLQYLTHVTMRHIVRHYHAMLLFEPTKEQKEKILDFERFVKEQSPTIYKQIPEHSLICRVLRMTNYAFYPQVIAYRKKKHKELYPQ